MATTIKLIEILTKEIKKTDGDKALDTVKKAVVSAQRQMRSETEAAEDAVETAKDRREAVNNNVNSTALDILNADRAIKLAEENAKAIKAIYEARF